MNHVPSLRLLFVCVPQPRAVRIWKRGWYLLNQYKVASIHAAHNIGNTLSCSCPKSSGRTWSDQQISDGPEGVTPMSSHTASLSVRKQRDSKNWADNREGSVSSVLCVAFVTQSWLILFILVFLHHSSVKHKAFTKCVLKPNQLSHQRVKNKNNNKTIQKYCMNT